MCDSTTTNESSLTFQHSSKKSFGTGDGFYNPKMSIGRDLAVLAAIEHCHQLKKRQNGYDTIRLLDGFSGVGVLALRWASTLSSHFNSTFEITANDRSKICQKYITNNIQTNNINSRNVFVTGQDVNCILSKDAVTPNRRPFDMIHLDPFGCVVQHLDAALRCLAGGGILSFTSTDVSALCDRRYRHVAKRHYGVKLNYKRNSENYHDISLRVILATVAKSAARQDKGIKILTAVSLDHFFLIQIQVIRGTKEADRTASSAEWMTKEGEGPLWSGKLGDSTFLTNLIKHAKNEKVVLSSLKNRKRVVHLLGILSKENIGDLSSIRSSEIQSKIINLNFIISKYKFEKVPKKLNQKVTNEIAKKYGIESASVTHLDPCSIRTIVSRSAVSEAVFCVVKKMGEGGDEEKKEIGRKYNRKRNERAILLSGSIFVIVLLHIFRKG
jgi:tRNA G26 N,N-dimethylase Trm1